MIKNRQNRTALERAELDAFVKRFKDLAARHGMGQSDIARALWGTTTDKRNRNVARNRDRISNYWHGKQMPSAKTIKMFADLFHEDPVTLAPHLVRSQTPNGVDRTRIVEGDSSELSVSLIAGSSPASALLTMNRVLPAHIAYQILALVLDAEDLREKKTK